MGKMTSLCVMNYKLFVFIKPNTLIHFMACVTLTTDLDFELDNDLK